MIPYSLPLSLLPCFKDILVVLSTYLSLRAFSLKILYLLRIL